MKKIFLLLLLLLIVIAASLLVSLRSVAGNIGFLKNIQLSKTPESIIPKDCSGQLTPALIEGPYYKNGSPLKTNFQQDAKGEKITLEGYIFDRDCHPISNVWIDFWQADATGNYDNQGFKLRGHQFSDIEGKYMLQTIIPGEYQSRTIHIHVKVQRAPEAPLLTTQIFLPDLQRESKDPIFTPLTLINVEHVNGEKVGYFNFVIQ